jgi:predicted N-acetyltransferase YhbS
MNSSIHKQDLRSKWRHKATTLLCQFISWKARSVTVSRAASDKDFEEIARFNYQIFSQEVGQHPENRQQKLVDSYHEANVYFVCRYQRKIIGMVCVTDPKVKGFSVSKKLQYPEILDPYRDDSLEVRLLAVDKAYRGTSVFLKLIQAIGDYALAQGAQRVFISGIAGRLRMYQKLGFEVIAEPAVSGRARYVPMMLTRERFLTTRQNLNF